MNREWRFSGQGLIFALTILALLLATREGKQFVVSMFSADPPAGSGERPSVEETPATSVSKGIAQTVAPFVAIAVVVFASGAVGSVINQLGYFALCLCRRTRPGRWYSTEWERRLRVDLLTSLDDLMQTMDQAGGDRSQASSGDPSTNASPQSKWFSSRYVSYEHDVLLSYFWQQADRGLVEWVSRRHTVFWNGCCTISAIIVGLACWLGCIAYFQLHVLWLPLATIVAVCAVFCILTALHADTARTEAWQLIDLWLAGAEDDRAREAVAQLKARLSPAVTEKESCASQRSAGG